MSTGVSSDVVGLGWVNAYLADVCLPSCELVPKTIASNEKNET
jgi:hypothetical protein